MPAAALLHSGILYARAEYTIPLSLQMQYFYITLEDKVKCYIININLQILQDISSVPGLLICCSLYDQIQIQKCLIQLADIAIHKGFNHNIYLTPHFMVLVGGASKFPEKNILHIGQSKQEKE